MNNTKDFLTSRLKSHHIEKLIAALQKQHHSVGGTLKHLLNRKKYLSKENAFIGLVLLNKMPFSTSQDSYYWSRTYIDQQSDRYNNLRNIASPEEFWNAKRYPLLEFLFGDLMAPWVQQALEMIPSLMYQSGYSRRSFRGSGFKSIHFVRQLNFIIDLVHEHIYDLTLEEYARYSNQVPTDSFSLVFACAISGDRQIRQEFLDTVYGRHETNRPSRSVVKAMLLTELEECWLAVEKLLLSAQRQEGLRQTILEALDETSLGAMKHMIHVVLEHKLTRFSAVVRAVDTWAGFGWESEKEATVRRFLEFGHRFLTNPSLIDEGVESLDNAEVYMALWAQGVIDVAESRPLIDKVLTGNYEKISLALYFLSQVGISSYAIHYGKAYLNHEDPVITCQAVALVNETVFIKLLKENEKMNLFDNMASRVDELPAKSMQSKARVFSWLTFTYSKEKVLDFMINLLDLNNEQDMDRILPYFEHLNIRHREKVVRSILPEYSGYSFNRDNTRAQLTQKKRDFAFSILKDRSELIRTAALRALEEADLKDDEIQVFEGLLVRKSADFRKSTIALILKHGSQQVKGSASRLLVSKSEEQRLAGLDLLLWLKKNDLTAGSWVIEQTNLFGSRPKITTREEVVLSGLIKKEEITFEYNAENGYGIFDPQQIPKLFELEKGKSSPEEKQGVDERKLNDALANLGKLVHSHKEYEYTFEDWNNQKTTELLGNNFFQIKRNTSGMTPEEKFQNYPLNEVWRKWYEDHQLTSRDLLRINLFAHLRPDQRGDKGYSSLNQQLRQNAYLPKIPKFGDYDWQNPIYKILEALEERYPDEQKNNCLERLVTTMFMSLGKSVVTSTKTVKTQWNSEEITWRDLAVVTNLWTKYSAGIKSMTSVQFERYWHLAHWRYLTVPEGFKEKDRYIPPVYDYARAFQNGLINDNLLYWRIMKPDAISALTKRVSGDRNELLKAFDFLYERLDKCRNRILEVELVRGDSSTTLTHLAQQLNRVWGIDHFVMLLKALGNETLHRGYIYSYGSRTYNKKEVLSTLLKNCFPSADCVERDFNRSVKGAGISDKRLCEAATYSPQWLPYVASYLGWKHMESAVWWLHAHTNGYHSDQTETEIAKYSSVDITAFKEGAVDIEWFREVYKSLKQDKWKKLYDAAKYISDGGGHKRGLLYTDVILGNIKITEVSDRITSKRNQDYLRVYGVIPLSKRNPEKDVLKRYQFLQNFKKESKEFGAQRQASEAIAVKVAMENLARTAGYPDPIRLQWSMETKEAQEIMEDAQNIHFEGADIKLEIDAHGKSSIVTYKEGKKLKSVPAKYKNDKGLTKLKAYNKKLREQYRRTRISLEHAMISGDGFSKTEVSTLMQHPVVAPLLSKLVLISNDHLGFWRDGLLYLPNGETSEVGEELRLAHCTDLYYAGIWSSFQQYCFDEKLKQPFKQIFRELYVPTEDELNEASVSRRYAGHQIQPRKTVALLKGQNWTVDYDSGLQKVHHKHNIIARMYAMADWFSPADVESPTLETVEFIDRENGKRMPFEQVNRRIFSETMRDIDLVVSVAHVGEVDPEASQSSIELRLVIIQETCRLFKLKNVEFSQSHAKIHGELGDYSVHLGSGICHRVAGASLSIIPVHSQHRGRMFLPFIDDDPKTAEIVSKVLLLAKDKEIQDPTILRQL